MNRKARKDLKSCFGTKEFSTKSFICKKCQHFKACAKEQRTEYPPLEPPFNPRWANTRKEYRSATME